MSGAGFNDPRVRGLIYQAVLAVGLAAAVAVGVWNAYVNMADRGIPMGFSFWNQIAGFAINLHLIPFTSESTYGQAFWVGLTNTLLVAVIGIPLTTAVGFTVGVARLSPNWLLSRSALLYTNILRNTPLLLQLLFWYNAVLKALPGPRQSISFGGLVFLNNRGLFLPGPVLLSGAPAFLSALAAGVVAALGFRLWARRRQERTGAQAPVGWVAAGLIVGLPAIAVLVFGQPFALDVAKLSGFNLKGGVPVIPELVALVFGLVTFTGAFIAEIVRAGVQAVPHGQVEAAAALGLHRGLSNRLVIVPQAMRLIVPPLTSQYVNLIKNSSLAVFIGYPDLVQIFAGTVLNQTQAAVQVMAITMAVYLVISLAIAGALNVYNARHALKER